MMEDVWVAAQIAAVVKQLYKWGYIYVENLTWVQMAPNNTIITAPAPYAQRSHLTLFIFRKAGERDCPPGQRCAAF
jgi:N6-adenosine-specific RNA methylase IME4